VRASVLLGVAACVLAFAAGSSATLVPTFVVDDDGLQCATAIRSIQAAVVAAPEGALIRVCPGTYAETVVVTKPLTIRGQRDAVEAIDCFSASSPELSAEAQAIVAPPVATDPAFVLAADDVDLSGFVVQGRPVGMTTNDSYSGYRVHHNLFERNREAIRFATGANVESRRESRFDHNCLRESMWGVVNVGSLINARIDHNETYRTDRIAFQIVDSFLVPGRVEDVSLDHNVSQLEVGVAGYVVSGSKRSRIVANTLDRVRIGLEIGRLEPNEDLEISGNSFVYDPTGPQPSTAIGFNPPDTVPNRRILVSANTITGYNTGIAIGGPPGNTLGSLTDSEISGNTITGSRQNAIRMRALNTAITVRANILNANAAHGIHAQCGLLPGTTTVVCPTGNTFVANQMLGNGFPPVGGVDARDDTGIGPGGTTRPLQNTWIANVCATDLPSGAICGVG
jgi:hypothetical protein